MHRSRRWKSPSLFCTRALIALALLLTAPAVGAQDLSELLARLEAHFVVHTLTDGYALQTSAGKDSVLVEVRAGAAAIDGEPVNDEELRARVGQADTEHLRALAALTADPAALRAARQLLDADRERSHGDLDGRDRDETGDPDDRVPRGARRDSTAEADADQQALEEERAAREREEQAERRVRAEERAAREQEHEAARRDREQERKNHGATPKRRGGDRFRLFRDVRVEHDETASEAVAVLGGVTVLGEVRSDAVAVGGSVQVEGTVRGDVISVGGSIILGPDAEIGGDATAVGGEVRRARGARVRGSISEVSTGRPLSWLEGEDEPASASRGGDGARMSARERRERETWRRDLPWHDGWIGDWTDYRLDRWQWFDLGSPAVFQRLVNAGLLIVITLILLLTARRATDRLTRRLHTTPWRAAATGLAVQVATLPLLAIASLVLLVSIIGIPLLLLIPVVLIVMVLASLLGYASAAAAVGNWLSRRLGRQGDGPLVVAFLGVLSIQGLSLVGEVLDRLFFPFGALGILLLAVGFCVRYLAWTMGLGAVVLDTFGGKRELFTGPPPPPPPVERELGLDPVAGWRT